MNIEHFAYSMVDPAAAARWYVDNLAMKILRKLDESPFTHFLADESGRAIIEIYNNPKAPPPDYFAVDPLTVHVALSTDDVAGQCARLVEAGASVVDAPFTVAETGDQLAMLRDPWGFPIQLAKRRRDLSI